MDTTVSRQEERNKKRGIFTSIAIHIGLILLALLPLLTYPDPPPGQEGILVNLGMPDVGQGDENAPPASSAEEAQPDLPDAPEPEPEPEPSKPEVQPQKKPEPVKQRETVTTEDPNEVALRKQKEKERQEQLERDREAERQRQAELDRQRREQEAREKAEAERRAKEAEAQRLKDLLSGGLSGSGEGKGNTGQPGNQGDPGGDPNSDILEGISTGSGRVGGGLGSRGVMRSPSVTDNSQDQGTVVVYVCVDASGNVIEAKLTQRGTTATSQRLISKAIENARSWRFSKGDVDKQCGTITYNFRVR